MKLSTRGGTAWRDSSAWTAPGTRPSPSGPSSDDAAFEAAVQEFRGQLDLGYIGTVPEGPGSASQVRDLPREADLVILRRPIAGG